MKLAEKTAKQADTARRRGEVQQKFAAMTEEEREAWRLARQVKRQDRRAETEQKRSKLQQVIISLRPKTSPWPRPTSSVILKCIWYSLKGDYILHAALICACTFQGHKHKTAWLLCSFRCQYIPDAIQLSLACKMPTPLRILSTTAGLLSILCCKASLRYTQHL